jgi:hypothetical protein
MSGRRSSLNCSKFKGGRRTVVEWLLDVFIWPRRTYRIATFASAIEVVGAGERSRTLDLRITNALLYQLSYTGAARIITKDALCGSVWPGIWHGVDDRRPSQDQVGYQGGACRGHGDAVTEVAGVQKQVGEAWVTGNDRDVVG